MWLACDIIDQITSNRWLLLSCNKMIKSSYSDFILGNYTYDFAFSVIS